MRGGGLRGCSGGLCEGRCFKGCGCCPMKIISCNVRGLGIFEKRKVVRKLVGEKKVVYFMYSRNKDINVE